MCSIRLRFFFFVFFFCAINNENPWMHTIYLICASKDVPRKKIWPSSVLLWLSTAVYYGCFWLSINLFRVEYNPANTSKGNEKWLELRLSWVELSWVMAWILIILLMIHKESCAYCSCCVLEDRLVWEV